MSEYHFYVYDDGKEPVFNSDSVPVAGTAVALVHVNLGYG